MMTSCAGVTGCGQTSEDPSTSEASATTLPAAAETTATIATTTTIATESIATTATTATAAAATTTVATTAATTSAATSTTQPSPAEVLVQGMTLRQKASQVLLLAVDGTAVSAGTRELLAVGPPGGILLLEHNVTGAQQVSEFTAALQEAAGSLGSRMRLFIAVDQEGGSVQRLHEGVPDVPSARTLGEDSSPAEAGRLAAETAAGLLALGVNMNLAPVADVVTEMSSFLYRRSYGGDPARVCAFAGVVTRAYSQAGLISVVKHFPGHGSASGNTHGEEVVSLASRADFEAVHLPPFEAAIAAGAEAVMMAHIVARPYDAERPASQSRVVICGLLRGQLGFTGLVVSDDLEMAAARSGAARSGAAQPEEAAVAALRTGCDLLICTGAPTRQLEVLEAIVTAVKTGQLSSSRLDEAVMRVLTLKLRHGIVVARH
jgi:beta-N-acetylhexosaminidase